MAEVAVGSRWVSYDPLNSAWVARVTSVSDGFVHFTTRGKACRLATEKFRREWEPEEDGDAE
jgi:hypothetical protein